MQKLIGANFKMFKTNAQLRDYFDQFKTLYQSNPNAEVVIAPMIANMYIAGEYLHKIDFKLGAQNMYIKDFGGFTGETSPEVLRELGTSYVIIGHSERRHIFGETDQLVNQKITTALEYGFRPIFCIGETLEQKESGKTKEVLARQIEIGLAGVQNLNRLDIAYEPVWAIGSGLSATPEIVADIHTYIRTLVPAGTRILYGGSVSPDNAESLINIDNVGGFLIGGASLDPVKFSKIIALAGQA